MEIVKTFFTLLTFLNPLSLQTMYSRMIHVSNFRAYRLLGQHEKYDSVVSLRYAAKPFPLLRRFHGIVIVTSH